MATIPNEHSGGASSAGRRSDNEVALPVLEPRRSRAQVGIGRLVDAAAAEVGKLTSVTEVPAIYLIERAAIRLRRLRWEALKPPPTDLTESAKEEITKEIEVASGELDSLKAYARPQASSASFDARARRVGMRVRKFFGLVKEQKP
jgi:hypothetical protein